MENLGKRKAELLKQKVEQRTLIEQRMEQVRTQNKKLQEQLDQTIEGYEDRFADTVNILEYDATRLEKKYMHGKFLHASEIPCLAARSDIATCYKNHKSDPGVCDAFVEALAECTSKTIAAK